MDEGREFAQMKSDLRHQRETDAAWQQVDLLEKRCRDLEDQIRLGPAYDVLVETTSLRDAKEHSEQMLAALVQQIDSARASLSETGQDAIDAESRRVAALAAAAQSAVLLDEVRTSLASNLAEAFAAGQKSHRLAKLVGSFVFGAISSFLATWLFEVFRSRLL